MLYSAKGNNSYYTMARPNRLLSILIPTVLCFTACGDDGDVLTTIYWTATNITQNNVTAGWPDIPTTTLTEAGGTFTVVTEADVTSEYTESGDDTASPTPTTGDEDVPPVPPSGCATLVEIRGRLAIDRHVMIDTSACGLRSPTIEVELDAFGNDVNPTTTALPKTATGCAVYGSDQSAAAETPDGVIVPIGGDDDAIAYRMKLLVNGEISDEVFVPGPNVLTPILEGFWPEKPLAPKATIRRQGDFSWALLNEQHLPGCDL